MKAPDGVTIMVVARDGEVLDSIELADYDLTRPMAWADIKERVQRAAESLAEEAAA
jgi:hypothetical protein